MTTVVRVLLILFLWPANFELTAKGKLQPAVRREVFANLDGEVIDVLVKHGDMVKKGQVLAEMRNTELEVQDFGHAGTVARSHRAVIVRRTRDLTDRTLDKHDESDDLLRRSGQAARGEEQPRDAIVAARSRKRTTDRDQPDRRPGDHLGRREHACSAGRCNRAAS